MRYRTTRRKALPGMPCIPRRAYDTESANVGNAQTHCSGPEYWTSRPRSTATVSLFESNEMNPSPTSNA